MAEYHVGCGMTDRLKAGDLIKCSDWEDVKRTLADLDKEGYHAVTTDITGRWIRIIADRKEYAK